ncbi:hypothetical protein PoB_002179500 [Plakobranchus ocellatus]|uniref:Uncharacterized protein n=1 Tax=Plakobranchus ocellatus TaxID=259542 RepID=A0AAV3ZL59_9GAST|nr:hypothetical protein PoB_002179500 [Plakobranchus ocellatus]
MGPYHSSICSAMTKNIRNTSCLFVNRYTLFALSHYCRSLATIQNAVAAESTSADSLSLIDGLPTCRDFHGSVNLSISVVLCTNPGLHSYQMPRLCYPIIMS